MELFRGIRTKIGSSKIAREVARTKRKVDYNNLREVKSIGVVWDASKIEEFPSISRFHQLMNEKNIELSVIGYYPGNELPDKYTALRYLRCIKREEVNYFYLPVTRDANAFIKKSFDVLIDINFDKSLPLLYLSSLSVAKLKVGLFDNEKAGHYPDLMIELKKPVKIDDYLTQIIKYLEMIDSGK